MSLRNLLVQFDVGVAGLGKLQAIDSSLKQIVSGARAVGGALRIMALAFTAGALVTGVKDFIETQLVAADALYNQAAKLGMTTDELQKYQFAAKEMGISTQETAVAIRFFNRAIGEAQLGTKSAVKTFAGLGMLKDVNDPLATTSDLLLKFSDRLEKMPSQGQRTAYVMRTLGRGGSALLPILQQGSAKLREVFQDVDELGGGFSQKFAESSHKTEVALKKLELGWRTIKSALVQELLPAFQWWIDLSTKSAKWLIYLSKHTYTFRTALIFLASTAALFAAAFAAAMAMLMWPLLVTLVPLAALVALMGLLYLAFDDFYTFLKGGDSLLGRFLDRLGGTGNAKRFRKELVDAFQKVWDAIGPLMPQLEEFGKAVIKAFLETIPYVIEWGGVIATYVVQGVDGAVLALKDMAAMIELVGKMISDLSSDPTHFLLGGGVMSDVGDFIKQTDAFTKAAHDRAAALDGLRDTLHKISAGPTPEQPGTGTGVRWPGSDDLSGLGLPPPPAPGHYAPVHVQVTNKITGGTNGAPPHVTSTVQVKTPGAKGRDTRAAIDSGMPVSGQ